MEKTQQKTMDSTVTAPAATVDSAVQPKALPVKSLFNEQIDKMTPTESAKILKQLKHTTGSDTSAFKIVDGESGMYHILTANDAGAFNDTSASFKIVEAHGGGYQVLYKTYDQSVYAREAQKKFEDGDSTKILPIAKAKLGDKYCPAKVKDDGCYKDSAGITVKVEQESFTYGKLAEFQATGLIVVMAVIIGLCLLCYLMNFIMAKLGLNKDKTPAPAVKPAAAPAPAAAPVAAPAAPAVLAPAHCDWDPNAKSVHPGMTNKQFQAFLSIAAIAALEEHPGLTNNELVVIMTAAATQVLGQPCRVTAYKNVNSPAWTIV